MKYFLTFLFFIFGSLTLTAGQPLIVQIKGMTCSACEEKVTKTLLKIPGVTEVKADAKTGKTTIQTDDKSQVTLESIKAAVTRAGFSVEDS